MTVAERLTSQALSGPPLKSAPAVAERLLAIQGQDPRGARLAVRARSTGLAASDVDRALDQRQLLITTVNRGTLHLIRAEDYPLLQSLTTPQLRTSSSTRLGQEGVSPEAAERGVRVIEKALAEGPQTRVQLRERLQAADVPTAGQALVHVIYRAALDGIAIRGPMVDQEHAFVLVRDWLGPQPRVDREQGLAELARRYLVGHGPASDRDLARWAGLPLRDARAGLEANSRRLHEREDGLVELRKRPPVAPLPEPRLLGAFDPLLLGWTSREDVIGEHTHLVTMNGTFKPVLMVKGRAVGTWRFPRGRVQLEPLERLTKKAKKALEADAVDVERFLAN